MKTIVILSDTHGNRQAIEKIDGVLSECDYIIHLGDTSSDGSFIRSKYPSKTYLVNGNCDLTKLGEDELVLDIEGVKIFATHGHLYSAKTTLMRLKYRAEELGAQIALYGHTHRADEQQADGVTIINPGNMSKYSQNSYCYLVINGGKAVSKTVWL